MNRSNGIRIYLSSLIVFSFLLITSCREPHKNWAQTNIGPGWSTLGGSLTGNYFSSALISDSPQIIWTRHTNLKIQTSSAISAYNQLSFTGKPISGCSFYTLNIATGRKVFCRRLEKDNYLNNPLTDNYGNVYTGSSGIFQAYDWSGPMRWRKKISGTPISSQFLRPGIICVLTNSAYIYIIDAHKGEILRENQIKGLLSTEKILGPILIDQNHSIIWLASTQTIRSYYINIRTIKHTLLDPESMVSNTTILMRPDYRATLYMLWQKNFSSPIIQIVHSPDTSTIYVLTQSEINMINANTSNLIHSFTAIYPKTLSLNTHHNIALATNSSIRYYREPILSENLQWNINEDGICSTPVQISDNRLLFLGKAHETTYLFEINTLTGMPIHQLPINSDCTEYGNTITINKDGYIILSLSSGLIMGLL